MSIKSELLDSVEIHLNFKVLFPFLFFVCLFDPSERYLSKIVLFREPTGFHLNRS